MLKIGAKLLPDNQERSPVHIAVIKSNEKTLRVILEHLNPQEKKDALESVDAEGFTPLMVAAWQGRKEHVVELIKHGALLNSFDKNKRTALHLCILKGNDDVIQQLIDSGCDVELTTGAGLTPLLLAVKKNSSETAIKSLLRGGASVYAKNQQGHTALHLATKHNRQNLIEVIVQEVLTGDKKLIDMQDDEGRTALMLSIELKFFAISKILTKSHADSGIVDKNGQNVLHTAVLAGNDDAIRMLCRTRDLMNGTQKMGQTPLHYACLKKAHSLVELLVRNGATLDVQDAAGNTPMHLCVMHKFYELAAFLVDEGASTTVRNVDRNTPLCYVTPKIAQQITTPSLRNRSSSLFSL